VFVAGDHIKTRFAVALAASAFLLVTGSASAHHAFAASYDENKPITLQGTVSKVLLVNPHSFIWLDVKKADGTVEHWEIEGGAPNSLFRHGFKRDSLPVGSEIKVVGYQAKTGETRGVGAYLQYADGRKIFMGGSAPGANGEFKQPAGAPK
jgi:hypothetical protein